MLTEYNFDLKTGLEIIGEFFWVLKNLFQVELEYQKKSKL